METKHSSLFRSSAFDKKILKTDLETIHIFYKNEGYLKAAVSNYQLKKDTLKKKVEIFIEINEGPLYKIKKIDFIGNKNLDLPFLLKNIPIVTDKAFNILSLERTKIDIISLYHQKGFLDVQVRFTYEPLKREEDIAVNFLIEEKTRYKIGAIRIEGLVKTKEYIVKREFRFKKGEYYSISNLLETQKYLYRTGLFYSVNIKNTAAVDGDSTKRDLLVKLKESEPGEFNVSLGYGSIEKIRLTSSVSYMNFFGRSYRGTILGRISNLEKRLETTLTDPWIFGIPVETSVGFEVASENQPSYDLLYYNYKLNFLKEFSYKFKNSILLEHGTGKYTDIKLDVLDEANRDSIDISDSLLVILLQNFNYNIDRSSIKFSLSRDQRDNIFNPKKGNYLESSIQYIGGKANLLFFETYKSVIKNKILKLSINYRDYFSITKSGLLASSLDFGIMSFFDSSDLIFLLSDLFYAGGPNSLRGFGYREVGPKDKNGIARGGKLKIVWNVIEYRQKILNFLDGALFIDAGNVWNNVDDFNWNDIRFNYGLGVRLDSPIGLIRFDYALNPFPQEHEAGYQFWFGIGQAF